MKLKKIFIPILISFIVCLSIQAQSPEDSSIYNDGELVSFWLITPKVVEVDTTGLILLTWTAPGDDGNIGTATSYNLRYSFVPIDESNFLTGTTQIPTDPPKPAGEAESLYVNLPSGTYYFAIKSVDELDNWSDLSNVLQSTIEGNTTYMYDSVAISLLFLYKGIDKDSIDVAFESFGANYWAGDYTAYPDTSGQNPKEGYIILIDQTDVNSFIKSFKRVFLYERE